MFENRLANVLVFLFFLIFVIVISLFFKLQANPIKDISTAASIAPSPKIKLEVTKPATESAELTLESSKSAEMSTPSGKKK